MHLTPAVNKTLHRLLQADACTLPFIPDESVQLIVTSPPYWNLKRYNASESQLGHINDYETFLTELGKVLHGSQAQKSGGRRPAP